MKYAYDLHMHTALSPCAEDDMTPNNAVNMAVIKGLDIIAITDHNTVKNCGACIEAAREMDLVVIPGMELQTKEDVHILCYFKDLDSAVNFEEAIDAKRLKLPNKPEKFGNQLLMNVEDKIVGSYPYALIASIDLTLEQSIQLVTDCGGVVVPAHLDRPSNSILSNLGFIPVDLKIKTIEISKRVDLNTFLEQHKLLKQYTILRSSDAHSLGAISEPDTFLEIDGALTIDKIFEIIRG